MAVFSVDINDADVNRVITAVCVNYGYREQIENPNFDPEQEEDPNTNPRLVTNPETTSQFANRKTRDFLMENTIAYEVRLLKESLAQPSPPTITDPN